MMATVTRVPTSLPDRVVDLITSTEGDQHVSTLHLFAPADGSGTLLSAEVARVPQTLGGWRRRPVPDSEVRAHTEALAVLPGFVAEHEAVARKMGLAA